MKGEIWLHPLQPSSQFPMSSNILSLAFIIKSDTLQPQFWRKRGFIIFIHVLLSGSYIKRPAVPCRGLSFLPFIFLHHPVKIVLVTHCSSVFDHAIIDFSFSVFLKMLVSFPPVNTCWFPVSLGRHTDGKQWLSNSQNWAIAPCELYWEMCFSVPLYDFFC